ncbi:bacterial Ig-like domain-containing protein [Lactonifactor longoviformis]|uniref:Ig-like domain (Group 3) n=1 Tax=Lactonifactor longoviformis DSM 17459 TaxID=1122155 RepID=A0A1M4XM58_9CLOT|nr:bacterial Ig-like domain-containing protein [Lactonifactor longoviformis]SHE94353.1 Ig-like domain (group 3) [Lactonifactor longoviformis DSM 17459]
MKKTRKRILSIFLTLLLTAGSVPVTAWAEDAADGLAFAKDYMKNGATFTYGTGKTPEALDGTATAKDGSSVVYQWYTSSEGKLSPLKNASSAVYTPDTEKAGTTIYVVEAKLAASPETALKSKEVKVIVKSAPEKITVTSPPKKTEYKEGESFDPAGMAVTAVYKKDSQVPSEVLSGSDYTIAPKGSLTPADTQITITYLGLTAVQPITVVKEQKPKEDPPPVLTELRLTPPDRTDYEEGDSLDITGLTVTAVYDKGDPKVLSPGEYTISPTDNLKTTDTLVTVGYSQMTASFPIRVAPAVTLDRIEVTKLPDTLSYTEGETFDPAGMEVSAFFTSGAPKVISSQELTMTPDRPLTAGDNVITITYQGKSTSFSVTVQPAVTLTGIEVTHQPDKLTYTEGERFDPSGMEVSAVYSDLTKKALDTKDIGFSPEEDLTLQDTKITLSYKDKTATLDIKVLPALVMERIQITAPPQKVNYTEGEVFDPAGMEVFAVYSDSTRKALDTKELSITPDGALKTTDTKVIVSYKGKTAEQKIQVVAAVTLEKITITTPPDKTKYTEGETFSTKGMEVTAVFSDSTKLAIDSKDLSISPDRALKTSDKTVTITYKGKTAEQKISVSEKTYKITVKDPSNGTITVSKTTAKEGDKITVTAKASKGYKLKNILVNKKAIKGNSFVMPAEDVTVTATFVKSVSSSNDSDSKTKTLKAAKTGDPAPILMLSLMAAVSAGAAVVLLKKKFLGMASKK